MSWLESSGLNDSRLITVSTVSKLAQTNSLDMATPVKTAQSVVSESRDSSLAEPLLAHDNSQDSGRFVSVGPDQVYARRIVIDGVPGF